ncbi:hypothetical protein Pmar_PMAR025547 [Perkinsus marinus ATCC 50983]|uniref:CAAX prenyl protease 2/Lysostaphin resistance protein A-like domain-containing protein n=1 Tax=Perkinsus marinus (strain ATCC 50983 / TXsc) TaxID=423536 RepID=C5LZC9_PERM5|nr:hypothetical protein Pmar_PMAR025547 [Perkinsus marinus ATCC 50983]EEQ97923.1 hypothetical protein Pmar_PMAR025547 [Perkinsus marinus ATCC 50983]|eukprot:XP_002765206.1 hypothetical protein Pmar_PMAR025547 [Perkinsus marinus ATCC 50983]
MPVLIVLGIYFALVNPLLEEFFWRVFLHRELGQSFFPQSVPDEEAEDFLDLENNTGERFTLGKFFRNSIFDH